MPPQRAITDFVLPGDDRRAALEHQESRLVRVPTNAAGVAPGPPELLLRGQDVGESFCNPLHCIVVTKGAAQVGLLRAMEAQKKATLEPLPDAHTLFFRNAQYDAAKSTYDRDFAGKSEVGFPTKMGQYVAVFKSYPQRAWLDELEKLGITAMEPVPSMGYYIYGPKDVIAKLPTRFSSFIHSIVEVPAGIKRTNVDVLSAKDDGGPASTTVALVAKAKDSVLDLLKSASGAKPWLVYSTGSIEAYGAILTREDALTFSVLPEVVDVSRNTLPGGPSDERSNRIIAGEWQTPGSSWPPSLNGNSVDQNGKGYWDNYQCGLSALGLDLKNQVIGFVDTGVDSGLMRGGKTYCPPHLRPPGYPNFDDCRLVFTADITKELSGCAEESSRAETKANDPTSHGTLTTSIAAGFATAASGARDTGQYAFSQGVAQGARVAMSRITPDCGRLYYRCVGAENFHSDAWETRLRYSLVELGSQGPSPDGNGQRPGVPLFNHSWNYGTTNYDTVALLIDQTSRTLQSAHYNYGTIGGIYYGDEVGDQTPALHVISAGNFPEYVSTSNVITAPAPAKNAITVGASETYNQEGYADGGCYENSAEAGLADNPRQIPWFSRTGFPNMRLKPDLVAPGTRSYGPRSVEQPSSWGAGCIAGLCATDFDGSGRYGWSWGTSFSAPAVTGAAAVTREWLGTLGHANASPALVKATLIATARSLTNKQACSSLCSDCNLQAGDVRPSPDKYQGWGGVAIDQLLRPGSQYFFQEQGASTTLQEGGTLLYSVTLALPSPPEDVNIALVWTDRAAIPPVATENNLVNDLDLSASVMSGGQVYSWYGNFFYVADGPDKEPLNSCRRDGYSLRNPYAFDLEGNPLSYSVSRDHKNNVERINIRAADIPAGVSAIAIQVSAFSLTDDGIDPADLTASAHRQDFALVVENAHE